MNFQNLIICDSKVIFDILNEIKEELNCNLLFKTKKEVLKISNLENYLILTVQKIDSLENQILIDNFPIQINKLLEIININLLKKNFNFQSEIIIGNYKMNLNSRTIYNKNIKLNLTEKETLLILHLKKKKAK